MLVYIDCKQTITYQNLPSQTVKTLSPAIAGTEGPVGGASLPRYARRIGQLQSKVRKSYIYNNCETYLIEY